MDKSKSKIPYIIGIAILLLVSAILAINILLQRQEVKKGKLALRNNYMRSLSQLSAYVTDMSETLEKIQYTGTAGQMQILSASLARDSSGAKNALSSVPTGDLDLPSVNKFLSQAGSYTSSLAKKLEYGEKLTDDEYRNIEQLKIHAENLHAGIYKLGEDIFSGKLSADEFYSISNESISSDDAETDSMGNQVRQMEEGFVSYPSLIYDGPFSDHLMNKNPALTQGKPNVTKEHALAIASQAAGVPVSFTQMENSNMPCYCFEGEGVSTAVTEKGGYVVYVIKPCFPKETKISMETAFHNAEKYLKNLGITSMKDSYYETKNNICTINYAYNFNGIICYTDLIKVSVNMENGEITGFDSRGYIMNHKERNYAEPLISKEKAAESVSSRLNIVSSKPVIIPTAGKNEIPVYEFKTKAPDGKTVLVYVNQNSGIEEQILILLQTENGILTV